MRRWQHLALGLALTAGGLAALATIEGRAHAQVLLDVCGLGAFGSGAMITLDAAIGLLTVARRRPRDQSQSP